MTVPRMDNVGIVVALMAQFLASIKSPANSLRVLPRVQ